MDVAVETGVLKISPVPKMHLGRKLMPYPEFLSEDEVRRFLNQARISNSEWHSHLFTAIYSGLRNGELYALRCCNIDFENRQMKINTAWTSKTGFKAPKTNRDRIVEIAPQLQHFKELKMKNLDSKFVLPRLDKWDKGEQARELRMFLSGMWIKPIKFHGLRATWATIMFRKGVPSTQVMAMAGWVEHKTMRHYIDMAGVRVKGITDNLNLHNIEDGKLLDFSDSNIK